MGKKHRGLRMTPYAFDPTESAYYPRMAAEVETMITNGLVEATKGFPEKDVDHDGFASDAFRYLNSQPDGERFTVAAYLLVLIGLPMLARQSNNLAISQGYTNYAAAVAEDDLENLSESWERSS